MKKIVLSVLATGVAGIFSAQAQSITWQTPQVISGTSDVLNNGNYFGSWAPFDGAASSLPVNGVTFQGNSDLPGINYNFSGGYGGGPYFGTPNTSDANYNSLLQYGQYAYGSGSSTIDWGGMTPGHTYEVQFWVDDVRGSYDRWENLSGGDIGATAYGTDSSGPLGYSSPVFSATTNPGYYVVGTFVADNSGSEEILLTPFNVGGGADSQANLFQVRDITAVPEPSMIGLLSAGGALMFLGLRRRG